jgi:hypothetical protein
MMPSLLRSMPANRPAVGVGGAGTGGVQGSGATRATRTRVATEPSQ